MTNGRVRELAHSHRKRLEQSPRGHDYSTQGDASALHLTRSSLSLLYPPRSRSASRLYVAACFIYSECRVRHSNVSARAGEIKLFFFLQLPVPLMANVSSAPLLFISLQTSALLRGQYFSAVLSISQLWRELMWEADEQGCKAQG